MKFSEIEVDNAAGSFVIIIHKVYSTKIAEIYLISNYLTTIMIAEYPHITDKF